MIPAHAIRPNDTSRQPRRFLWLDTEAREDRAPGRRTQRWRLAVTAYDGWSERRGAPVEPVWRRHESPAELWSYVSGIARRRSRLVVCAHNLAYDLRIATAFHVLPGLGWTVWRLGLHERAINVTWRRADGAALVMVDSYAWLPMTLAAVGELMGYEKLPLPAQSCETGWWERCERDVEILREAMRRCWGWVEQADAGTWQRTGAGQASTFWRHRHYTHRVVVHDSAAARLAEEASCYGGRCEAWRWGPLPRQRWTEYDLPTAHARLCSEARLPVALVAKVGPIALDRALALDGRWRYLCEAEVTQSTPVLPTTTTTGIVWGAGELAGWWWDEELALARAEGAEVRIRSAWRYAAAPALRAVSEWMVAAVEREGVLGDPVTRAMVKHWSRAFYGRFATRYQEWATLGPGPDDEVVMMPLWDRDRRTLGHLLRLGPETRISTGEQYGADACVAIWSAILAGCRVRCWGLMRAAGLDHLAYVDTDSVLVDDQGRARLEAAIAAGELWGLRRKGETRSVVVDGPRQLRFGRSVRYAGVPREGRRLRGGEWAAERWESITGAFGHGRADEVVIAEATWVRRATDRRRAHLPGGLTGTFSLVPPIRPGEAPRIASAGRTPRRTAGPRTASG